MRKCIVKARLTTTNKTLRRGLCLSAARLLFLAIKNQKISGTRKRASTAAYAWVLLVVSVCELIGIHQIRNPRSVLICFKPHPSRAPTSSPFLPKPWQQFYFIACAPRRKKRWHPARWRSRCATDFLWTFSDPGPNVRPSILPSAREVSQSVTVTHCDPATVRLSESVGHPSESES